MPTDETSPELPAEEAGHPDRGSERRLAEATNPFTRHKLFEWAMPAAVLFVGLFYILPVAYFLWPLFERFFPRMPANLGAPLALGIVYVVIWFGMWRAYPEKLPRQVREDRENRWWFRMQRRTGVAWRDIAGFLLAGGLTVVLALSAPMFAPALGALAVGFLGMWLTASNEQWKLLDFQRDLPDLPEPIPEEGRGDLVQRNFAWDYERDRPGRRGFHNEVTIGISQSTLDRLRATNPFNTGEVPADRDVLSQVIARLVHEGTTFEVREAARYLLGQARAHGLTLYEEIDNALRMVQATITYRTDQESVGREYWRFPIETLHDQVGDCDCKAILAAALFRVLFTLDLRSFDRDGGGRGDTRRDVVLLLSEVEAHAALAVEGPAGLPGDYLRIGERCYYFCESTGNGMRVGQKPPSVAWQNYRIIRLEAEDQGRWRRRAEP